MITPYLDEAPGPLEVICRLAGRTSFVTPAGGRGGVQGGGTVEIAHALATASDPLGARLAMAIACPELANLTVLADAGALRLQRALMGTWKYGLLVDGPRRYRIRVVLADVLAHLVHRPRAVPMDEAARQVRMRRSAYNTLYRYIASDMEQLARTAAKEACAYLFGP